MGTDELKRNVNGYIFLYDEINFLGWPIKYVKLKFILCKNI